MNILITIFLVIAGLIALLLVLALLGPKKYSIRREITINRPKQEVFDYVKYLRNQENFNKWTMMDPHMKQDYRGIDGNVGFVHAWDGNKEAGAGEQEIKSMVEGERIDVEVRFIRPFKGLAQTPLTLEAVSENQTRITWGMSSKMSYPMNIMLLFMSMDKALGPDLETSLGLLKDILENKKDPLD